MTQPGFTGIPQDADATPKTEHVDVTETLLPSGRDGFTLSPEARHHLDEQLAAAGGNVDTVARDIQARLDEIDATRTPDDSVEHSTLQAERAFHVAQLSYLELVMNQRTSGKA